MALEDRLKAKFSQDLKISTNTYGFNPFYEEVSALDGSEVIWTMNQYGLLVPSDTNMGDVRKHFDDFKELFSRGFDKDFFVKINKIRFENKFHGDLNLFSGQSNLYHEDKRIYYFYYNGGKINQ